MASDGSSGSYGDGGGTPVSRGGALVWGSFGFSAKIGRGEPPLLIEGLRWRGEGKKREIRIESDLRRRGEEGRRKKEGEGDGGFDRAVGPACQREKERSGAIGHRSGKRIGSDPDRIGPVLFHMGSIRFRLKRFFLFY